MRLGNLQTQGNACIVRLAEVQTQGNVCIVRLAEVQAQGNSDHETGCGHCSLPRATSIDGNCQLVQEGEETIVSS